MNNTKLEKLIEEIVNEALEEVNAISAGGGSLQPSGQVSGTGGNPLGRDMSDQYEIMWSGDEPEEGKKKKNLKEEILDEEDLDEFNAVGTGAVVGYTLPLGMKPDYGKMGTKGKKRKRPRRWYDVHKESDLEEEFIGKRGGVSYFQIGGSLPDELYNRTDDGKPTRDPGVAGIKRPKKKK